MQRTSSYSLRDVARIYSRSPAHILEALERHASDGSDPGVPLPFEYRNTKRWLRADVNGHLADRFARAPQATSVADSNSLNVEATQTRPSHLKQAAEPDLFERDGRLYSLDERGRRVSDRLSGIELKLDKQNYDRFVKVLITYIEGKRPATIRTTVCRIACPLSAALSDVAVREWPTTRADADVLLRAVYKSSLLQPSSKASIETRVKAYNSIVRPFLQYGARQGLLPIDVVVPAMKRVGQISAGETLAETLIDGTDTSTAETDSYLLSVDLSRTDIEYLNNLQIQLETKLEAIDQTSIAHIIAIEKHWSVGQEIIRRTDIRDLRHAPASRVCVGLLCEEIALSSSVNDGVYNSRLKHQLVVYCWRALKTDHLCSLKIDQGWTPRAVALGVLGL